MSDKKTKTITIVALIVAVIGLSVGFAAFSSTLNITSGASVNPTNDFYIKFADNVTGSDNTFTSYTVNNVFADSASTGIGNDTGGVIDNSDGRNPVIGDLTAAFTEPGQSVIYKFYVVNDSAYDAYLTSIEYMNGKTCTTDLTDENPANQSLVDSACAKITSTVTVGGLNTVPQTLGSKEYKEVIVTINYASDAPYVDGAFNVEFGDIKLVFSTVSGETPIEPIEEETDDSCFVVNNIYQDPTQTTYTVKDTCPTTMVEASGGQVPQEYAEVLCSGTTDDLADFIATNFGLDNREEGYAFLFRFDVLEQKNNTSILGKKLVGYTCTDKDIVMPSNIDGVDVKSIGTYSFANIGLTSVVIPDTVTTIEPYAFQFNNISSIDFGSSVTSIGSNAFQINNFASITIPDSVESIGDHAFDDNNSLTTIVIGSGIKNIGKSAFTSSDKDNGTITSVTIKANPSNVTLPGDSCIVFGWAEGYSDANIVWQY